MNALQLYYIQEVLGIKTGIKPRSLKLVYQLSQPLSVSADFLFFCGPLKAPPQKTLVKNIAKAIKAEEEQVIEILDFQYPKLTSLFQTLLSRFPPQKGLVIFGQDLAEHFAFYSKSSLKGPKPMCVIPSISQLTELKQAQAQKQTAWVTLHKTFLQKKLS